VDQAAEKHAGEQRNDRERPQDELEMRQAVAAPMVDEDAIDPLVGVDAGDDRQDKKHRAADGPGDVYRYHGTLPPHPADRPSPVSDQVSKQSSFAVKVHSPISAKW